MQKALGFKFPLPLWERAWVRGIKKENSLDEAKRNPGRCLVRAVEIPDSTPFHPGYVANQHAGAGCGPRITFPGIAPVGSPFSYETAPLTIV
jgi:hypothetical protein